MTHHRHEPERIGSAIGNYIVRTKIGEGGMGVVYLAENPHIGRRVAIKVLHAEHGRDHRAVMRFSNEARAAHEIKNPHIVEILDFGILPDDSPYFVMEWLDGPTLARVLSTHPRLSLDRALTITLGICHALAAAHDSGIVHRDLKPENVVLITYHDEPDFVKVVDFGIAKLLSGHNRLPQLRTTTTRTVMGTWAYMSPEQCRGDNDRVDARSDIYALGIMLYEMVTGRLPFLAEGTGMLLAHTAYPPPPPRAFVPDLPEPFEAALLRALAKEQADRFQSIDELVIALTGMPLPGRRLRTTGPRPVLSYDDDEVTPAAGYTHLPTPTPTPTSAVYRRRFDSSPAAPTQAVDVTPVPVLHERMTPVPELAAANPPPAATASTQPPTSASDAAPQLLRRVILSGGALLAAAILGALAVWYQVRSGGAPTQAAAPLPPPPQPTAPAVASSQPQPAASPAQPAAIPAMVHVSVHTIPATAKLTLDGAALTNPFTGTFPRSYTPHLLVARARERAHASQWVVFDQEHDLVLVLRPKEPHAAVAPAEPPREPAAAQPPAEPSRGKRNKPKIITDFPE